MQNPRNTRRRFSVDLLEVLVEEHNNINFDSLIESPIVKLASNWTTNGFDPIIVSHVIGIIKQIEFLFNPLPECTSLLVAANTGVH